MRNVCVFNLFLDDFLFFIGFPTCCCVLQDSAVQGLSQNSIAFFRVCHLSGNNLIGFYKDIRSLNEDAILVTFESRCTDNFHHFTRRNDKLSHLNQ